MAWPTLLMLVPVVLIIRQPDLGTALLLIVIFAPIVFMMGIRFRTILSVTGLILVSLPLVWIYLLKPYQQERILDRKSTRLNSSHSQQSRMPSSA